MGGGRRMISMELYKAHHNDSRSLAHCWVCGHKFVYGANDGYVHINQCADLNDKYYKEIYFCKNCWLEIAGEDWTIEGAFR
jgi:hypothetical protein